jgi:hypothetical protein
MTSTRPELTGVAGVPETALSEALLAGVPAQSAPAPWTAECRALLWLGRGGAAARAALPPALRGRARGLGVVGALVRYLDTPVGAYDEVLGLVAAGGAGAPVWGSVAFMAVDSPTSLVGGRVNWAMPKTLADFDGDPAAGGRVTASAADSPAWRVAATARPFGPAVPVRLRSTARQEFSGGRVGDSRLTGRGRVRLATVQVDVTSEGPLPGWLRPGRHLGAVVEHATFTLSEPRFG